jgi:hypothetical protein
MHGQLARLARGFAIQAVGPGNIDADRDGLIHGVTGYYPAPFLAGDHALGSFLSQSRASHD